LAKRFLLYIDILGFSNLVSEKSEDIAELYQIIDSLNVHSHYAFRTLIFSDTILVYNELPTTNVDDINYLVMYLCEFSKDLEYRLTSKKIFFRAYLTYGDFIHEKLKHCDAFYGQALIEAYKTEKKIQAIGLFMDDKVVEYSNIFHLIPYEHNTHFVFTRQVLEDFYNFRRFRTYPISENFIEQTDEIWFLANDIVYLESIFEHKENMNLSDTVRTKHSATWNIYNERYPAFLAALEANKFNPKAICNKSNWEKSMHQARKESFV